MQALLTLPDQDIASAIELVKVSVYYVLEQPIQLQALRECLQKALGDGPPETATFIPLPRLNDNQQVVCDAYFLTNRAQMPECVARLEGAPIAETTTARVVDGLRCGELAWCSGQTGCLSKTARAWSRPVKRTSFRAHLNSWVCCCAGRQIQYLASTARASRTIRKRQNYALTGYRPRTQPSPASRCHCRYTKQMRSSR